MIPAVIDRVDNRVDGAYQGKPDRLYLVGKDGRIAYAGSRGPRGFKPDELRRAIDRELGKNRSGRNQVPVSPRIATKLRTAGTPGRGLVS